MGPIMSGRPTLRWDAATTNAVFDGNSLVLGIGADAAHTISNVLAGLAPINSAVPIANLGVNGRSIAGMTDDAAAVDAKYVSGKKNVLFVLEGTNSVYGGRSAAQCYADMTAYCTRVLVNPWIIVLVSTPPFTIDSSDYATTLDVNTRVDGFNALMKANYRAMGAKFYVDLRLPGTLFDFPNYTQASFDALNAGPYYDSTSGVYKVHFGNNGYTYIAQVIASAIRRLPAR